MGEFVQDGMRAKCVFVVAKAVEDKFAALMKRGENSKESEEGEIFKVKESSPAVPA